MGKLYTCLDGFIDSSKQSDYLLKGFGSFGKEVIYVSVLPSVEMQSNVHDLMTSLHTISNLTFDEFDEIENDFHATVVMGALKPFNYDQL